MAGTKGRTGFNRMVAGRGKGNGMRRGKRGKLSRMHTRNKAGGR